MLALKCTTDDRVFYLSANKLISIGRNVDLCELAITCDTSVSRKHCSINVSENVILKDHASRYGTYINDGIDRNERIPPNDEVNLQVGDNIRFGIKQNTWRVVKHSFITCCSKLNPKIKLDLQTQLKILQGSVSEDCNNECNYLTMTKITLTQKVVMALIHNANIVVPEYWRMCVDAYRANTAMPSANGYLPSVLESTLNQEKVDFLPNKERKKLFSGKKVIFFSRKQKSKYDDVITCAGGSCIALSDSKLTKSMLCSQDVFVVQYLSNANTQESQINLDNLTNIVNYIESKGKRLIPEAEIALAILYCSLDKYCNPNFDFPKQVCANSSLINDVPKGNVLAVETQESIKSKVHLTPKIIEVSLASTSLDSTCEKACSPTIGDKRKLTKESLDSDASKRVKLDSTNSKTMFQFVEDEIQQDKSSENENSKPAKLLNLILPKKQKRNKEAAEDQLFNFECDPEPCPSPKRCKLSTIFAKDTSIEQKLGTINENKRSSERNVIKTNKKCIIDNLSPWLSKINHSAVVKQEKDEVDNVDENDLDLKLSSLDLGQTMITAKSNLIVKKENLVIQKHVSDSECNFKKFQKVKPLYPQKHVIPKSTMVAYRPVTHNIFNTIASDNEGSDDDELTVTMNRKMIGKKSNTKSRRL